jgi:hypothetical protein
MGHTSIQVTFDVYSHLLPGVSEQPTEGLDAASQRSRVLCRVVQPWCSDGPKVLTLRPDATGSPFDQGVYPVPPAGLEPATHGLGSRRSAHFEGGVDLGVRPWWDALSGCQGAYRARPLGPSGPVGLSCCVYTPDRQRPRGKSGSDASWLGRRDLQAVRTSSGPPTFWSRPTAPRSR